MAHFGKIRSHFGLAACIWLVVVMLAGCGGGSDSTSSAPKTTVLVYMIGSDLESGGNAASDNITDMMVVGSTANMNVIIQTGGANKDPLPYAPSGSVRSINWKDVQRYRVNKGSIQLLADLGTENAATPDPALNMGNKQTLQNFLDWGVSTYPADRYVLVLWDHGGGINSGIGPDEITGPKTNPTPGTISMPGLREALNNVVSSRKVRFEVIGFDACLMATAEVASGLSDAGRYMVASQDLSPGPGWNYTELLSYLTNNPSANGAAIGKSVADAFLARYVEKDPVTLSVTDLSKATALSNATDRFATALFSKPDNIASWRQMAYARAYAMDWSTYGILGVNFDLVDIASFASEIKSNFLMDTAIGSAADALTAALNDAVIYKVASGSNDGASGLTFYFPERLSAFDEARYPENTRQGGSRFFANAYADVSGLVQKYYNFYKTNYVSLIQPTVTMLNNGTRKATITRDFSYALAAHELNNCTYFTETTASALPTTGACFDTLLNASDVSASGSGYEVNYTASNEWPKFFATELPGTSFLISLVPDRAEPNKTFNQNLYFAPVFKPQSDGSYDEVFLIIEEVITNGVPTYKVTGYTQSLSTAGKSARFEKGDKFYQAVFYKDTTDGSYKRARTNSVVTIGDSLGVGLNFSAAATNGAQFGYFVIDLAGGLNVPATLINY